MRELPLEDIIAAHIDALAAHVDEFLPMIRYLLLLGEGPVTSERLASALRWSTPQAEAFLQAASLTVDDAGNLQMVDSAGCALDRLLAPMLTGCSAHVVATCPASGRRIRLTATPQGVDDLDPPAAVVSLRLPGAETTADTVLSAICAHGQFFADRKRAVSWPRLHPEALLLSVADATHLAHSIADAARENEEAAQICVTGRRWAHVAPAAAEMRGSGNPRSHGWDAAAPRRAACHSLEGRNAAARSSSQH